MKNPWSERNAFLKSFIPDDISIVDIGCGNKEILDFCKPSKYLGIDILPDADLIMNLDFPFSLKEKYDLGLVLGVLEYLDDPDYTLSQIKDYADKFIFLTCAAKKKQEWKQSFNKEQFKNLIIKHFDIKDIITIQRYNLIIAETGKDYERNI